MSTGTVKLHRVLRAPPERIYKAFLDAKNGTWKPGQLVLGLAEGGVDYSYDEHNRTVLTPAMKQRLDAAKAEIISGKIQVYDEILNLCDYQNLLMRRAVRQSQGLPS